MARLFGNNAKRVTSTIFGIGEVEIDMVARLNQMSANDNLGHSGTVPIGDGGTRLGHSNQLMPAQQNFTAPPALQSLGSIRGQRAGRNQGLPNTQPPSGVANPLLNLLLPAAR